jgi:hypothetical protein
MYEVLSWLYAVNAVLLIVHEIDSAYWKEWELFHLPGGISGFLALHIPLILVVFYGFSRVVLETRGGLVFPDSKSGRYSRLLYPHVFSQERLPTIPDCHLNIPAGGNAGRFYSANLRYRLPDVWISLALAFSI